MVKLLVIFRIDLICQYPMGWLLKNNLLGEQVHHYAELLEEKHAVLSNSEDQYMKFLVTDYELDRDLRLS